MTKSRHCPVKFTRTRYYLRKVRFALIVFRISPNLEQDQCNIRSIS